MMMDLFSNKNTCWDHKLSSSSPSISTTLNTSNTSWMMGTNTTTHNFYDNEHDQHHHTHHNHHYHHQHVYNSNINNSSFLLARPAAEAVTPQPQVYQSQQFSEANIDISPPLIDFLGVGAT